MLVRDLATALDGHGGISSITLNDDYTLTFTMADETTVTTTSVRGATGAKGDKGTDGRAITSVTKTDTSGLVDTYKIKFSDNTSTTFTVTNGASIKSIAKTGTSGLVDTYTVTLTDNTTSTFTVTNGNGIASIALQSGTHAAGTTDVYKITFDNGQYTTFSVYNGLNGSGSVATVNDKLPDASGNVSLAATDVGAQPATNDLEAETNLTDGDFVPFYDTSASAGRKTLWSNIVAKIRAALFGSANGFLKANGSGVVSAVSTIPVASGGTGATTAAAARANLGALSSADGAVETAKIKDKAVTMAKLADHAVSVVKSFQLPTTGWTKNSDGVYEANVTVSGLKTTDTVILGLRRGTTDPDGWTLTPTAFDSDRETFSKILAGRITAANTLHLYANETITNAIYLNCWVVSK